MIPHNRHRFFGINILFRVHGSAMYKAIVPSTISTGILLLMKYALDDPMKKDDNETWFGHPYPLAAMITAFTFLLTFKSNFSYNRYWEACTAVHQMHSKWLDLATEIAAFHMQSAKFDTIRPPSFGQYPHMSSVIRHRERTPRKRSMINEQIRSADLAETFNSPQPGKVKLEATRTNLIPIPSTNIYDTPQTVKTSSRPGIQRLLSKSVLDGGVNKNEPSLFLQEAAHLISLVSAVAFATLRGDIEGIETPLEVYNPGDVWPPMDPDKFREMKGHREDDDDEKNDFFDGEKCMRALSFLYGASRSRKQQTKYNARRPFGVLGGVSDGEISLLKSARGPLAKTALCTFWLQEFIAREQLSSALGSVPPPIVSRLFQFCSDGMVGYNQARKVAYIPFPFPHSQLTAYYVMVMMVFIPILMLAYVNNTAVAAVLNFLTATCFVGLHEVGKELEEPFRNAPNDLPLNNLQAQFNEALVTMYAGFHPEAWWNADEEEQSEVLMGQRDNNSPPPIVADDSHGSFLVGSGRDSIVSIKEEEEEEVLKSAVDDAFHALHLRSHDARMPDEQSNIIEIKAGELGDTTGFEINDVPLFSTFEKGDVVEETPQDVQGSNDLVHTNEHDTATIEKKTDANNDKFPMVVGEATTDVKKDSIDSSYDDNNDDNDNDDDAVKKEVKDVIDSHDDIVVVKQEMASSSSSSSSGSKSNNLVESKKNVSEQLDFSQEVLYDVHDDSEGSC